MMPPAEAIAEPGGLSTTRLRHVKIPFANRSWSIQASTLRLWLRVEASSLASVEWLHGLLIKLLQQRDIVGNPSLRLCVLEIHV